MTEAIRGIRFPGLLYLSHNPLAAIAVLLVLIALVFWLANRRR